jgi:putative ABC transport system permease protein
MDTGVVAFALLISVVTGALCSVAPAFAALRTNLTASLNDGARTGTGTASHAWLRSALVVAEIAIALILLTVSGEFLRSFQKMRAVDPGFRPDHVLVAGYQLPLWHYPTAPNAGAFEQSVLDRLSAKPGIAAVATTSILPGSGLWGGSSYTVEGVRADAWKLQFAMISSVRGDFFRAMGIRLLDGRAFTVNDRVNAPLVVIVNESMAKHCWPGQPAIGKRIHGGNPKKGWPWATIVGVVADTKLGARDEPDSDQWYVSSEQSGVLFGEDASSALSRAAGGYIALRAALPAEQMAQTLRVTVAEIDPALALQHVQPMTDVISNVEAPRRFNTDLITAFAAGALLLAITGIYAVVTFSVSLRTQEIAIRMALGAERGRIVRLVLTSGARIALLGCAIGFCGSLAVSRLVASFLFNVSATDPLIYFAAALTMLAMTLLASAIPARRAASADPLDALRAN